MTWFWYEAVMLEAVAGDTQFGIDHGVVIRLHDDQSGLYHHSLAVEKESRVEL